VVWGCGGGGGGLVWGVVVGGLVHRFVGGLPRRVWNRGRGGGGGGALTGG